MGKFIKDELSESLLIFGKCFMHFRHTGLNNIHQRFFVILAVLPDVEPGQVKTEYIQVP